MLFRACSAARTRRIRTPLCELRSGSLSGEGEFVVTNSKHITLADGLALHALPVEFNPVGRPQVHQVICAIGELNHCVLARNVGIFDRQVACLFAATDDEALFGDRKTLSQVVDVHAGCGGFRSE